MKVLVVAKTRRGAGACVGGITEEGTSVRLIASDAAQNERAGLEYNVGEVWEIDFAPDPEILPPHVENIIVLEARKLRVSTKLRETVDRFMPPSTGGPEILFEGLARVTTGGALYVAESTGLPSHSTMFWRPDKPLRLDCEGKRIRYRYPTADGGRAITFVGFQEPLPEIPAGTLLRISLAHHWRPSDKAEDELRCFVQLSGWFLDAPQRGEQNRSAGFQPAVSRVSNPLASRLSSSGVPAGSKPGAKPAKQSHFGFERNSKYDLSSERNPCQLPLIDTPGRQPAPLERSPAIKPIPLERALETMKRTFGFSEFLPVQREVMERVLQWQDSLVIMPTGGGKSLCYQLPALLFEGLTVVISPLIALMQDQVRQLSQVDVPAACLNHTVSLSDYTRIAHRARQGQIKILYLAPETLMRPETILLLEQSKLACLAIDEAHCISEWGHDFRPEYRQLQSVRDRFRAAVCLALTATATARVRQDIRRQLGIPAEGEFIASFNRKNLFVAVEPRKDVLAQILAFLQSRRDQSGIIYCGARKKADELCAALNANQWPALPYHAGLEPEVRHRNQERFIYDDVPIIVATIAFGMGINKPNIRFVIHAHLPKDLESYYQEIGRGGRDGLPADCLLLYSRGDAVMHRTFIDEGAASERAGRQARLNAIMRFAETRECRRRPLLAYFEEQSQENCGNCDNCVQGAQPRETRDMTPSARKFLTCVNATGQFFGPGHIIAVLRGSRSERVLSRRHDQLPCYAQGKEHSTEEWQELARQFINLGLLDQDLEFGSMKLTPKGREVLQGKQSVAVAIDLAPAEPKAAARVRVHDPKLFEELRVLRRQIADEERVPAFFIFSDRALMEMASGHPQNAGEFLGINGVGEARLARYGDRFLDVIRKHAASRDQHPQLKPTAALPIQRPVLRLRFHEIGERFLSGQSLEKIAAHFQIKRETVVQNIAKYVQEGGRADPGRILACSRLSPEDRERVLRSFDELGFERLAPVYQALSGTISYEELQLLRLYVLCQSGSTGNFRTNACREGGNLSEEGKRTTV